MNTKPLNKVHIIKWTGQETGAYCSGILGIYTNIEDAQHFMTTSVSNLVESGYFVTRRNINDYKLVRKSSSEGNTDTYREMTLYLETYKVQ